MMIVFLSAALQISCVDGVAVVDQPEYVVKHGSVIEWHAKEAFQLDFDSPGNKELKSHQKEGVHERRVGASSLKVGRNHYDISMESCMGDPVIIVER